MDVNNGNQLPVVTHTNPAKYKTLLCKHFASPKGCSFGDKCQFAHGIKELKSPIGQMNNMGNMGQPFQNTQKKGPNPQNFKIVKCKYWEKDHTCRYGLLCTYAHGDEELRTKSDNIMAQNANMMPTSSIPGMSNQPMNMMGFDPNIAMAMQNMMLNSNPNMGMGVPNMNSFPGSNMQGVPMGMMNDFNLNPNFTGGNNVAGNNDLGENK